MNNFIKNHKIILIFFSFFVILISIFLIYAHIEYKNIKVKKIILYSKDIPKNFDRKKILFLADFQFDTMTRFNEKQLEKVVKIVNLQEKDIILIGGDYATWKKNMARTYKELAKIKKPKYGIYTVLGNHDYEIEKDSINYHKKLDFNLLRNEKKEIFINNEKIVIAGVGDLWNGNPNATKALENVKEDDFVILLNHNPEYFEYMSKEEHKKTDIVLSGHTHGGQITFFGKIFMSPVKNKFKQKYDYGMKNYEGNKIYITSGVGGAAFEMFIRFFARPEIVIFELHKS